MRIIIDVPDENLKALSAARLLVEDASRTNSLGFTTEEGDDVDLLITEIRMDE